MIYGSKTDKNPSNFDTMILAVTLISYLSASFFVCFFWIQEKVELSARTVNLG